MPKPLTVWITTNCGKFFKKWEYQTTLPASWEICMQVKKQLDMEQQTSSKLGKEYIKALYCHSAYLTSMQSMSCKIPSWMNEWVDKSQVGIKISGRNVNDLRYADNATLIVETKMELKSFLMKVKDSEKPGLKLNIQTTKIMASCSITYNKQMGKNWKWWQILFSWAPKSLWMVTAVMKLKDVCSLEEKLWQT